MLGAIATAILAAGCGSSSSKSSSNSGGSGAKTVEAQITKDGCAPAAMTLDAGPTNFVITNKDSDTIDEFEIKDGDKIIGEAENLAPGLSGKFSITLKPGTYATVCPGGKSGTLT